MTGLFVEYADYYDILYTDKDYSSECDYLERLWRRFGKNPVADVLDLGCGTGRHALELARRGYRVTGVDGSKEMIRHARHRARQEGKTIAFECGDISEYDGGKRFDAAIAMFAVMGYVTENARLETTLRRIRSTLRPAGLFIFDVWYGPAVLSQRPEPRLKVMETGSSRIYRFAEPSVDDRNNRVAVDYRILDSRTGRETQEVHRMRYFFLPELNLLASHNGFCFADCFAFQSLSQSPSPDTWNISCIFEAV